MSGRLSRAHTRREFLERAALAGAGMLAARGARAADPAPRPNIVVIMADDMGYSDIAPYGGEIDTPNLARLAREGARFTQFYNNAKCAPTRASLLTGLYSQQAGCTDAPVAMRNCATLAEVLRGAGYATYMAGKWHAGELPVERGFDRHFGLVDGCCTYFNPGEQRPGEPKPAEQKYPRKWARDAEVLQPFTPENRDFYTTDAFTDAALEYLDGHAGKQEPFFLYLPYTSPHYPLQAPPEDIAKYRGKYLCGWDAVRAARFQRMRDMGLLDPRWELSPRDPEIPAWDDVENPEAWKAAPYAGKKLSLEDAVNRDLWDLKMAVYAAMVDRMDRNIGRVLDKLDAMGAAENTLVLFLSDNGGCAELRNDTPDVPPGTMDSYRSVDPPWANAQNTPYRKFKRHDHEGGVATPCIARWPGRTPAGGIIHQVAHLIDVMPTALELSGAAYPAENRGESVPPPEGMSLAPVLRGGAETRARELFWQFGTSRAVRSGDWKAVREGDAPWELYDLAADRTETQDLAAAHPDIVERLSAAWAAWAARVAAPPQPAKRPNILWLSCEDTGPHLGCYGDAVARTPVLDALAAAGCRYTHCYTTAPVCSPNRSSIITGVHATTLGSHHMRSGGEGKKGSSRPALPPEVECFPALLRRAGYYCCNNEKEDYNFARPDDVWDDSSRQAHWRNRKDAGQPFFAVFNYTGTHESQVARWSKGADKAEAEETGTKTDPAAVTPPPYHADTPVIREQWAHYYDLVAGMDAWAGRLLAELEADGLAEDTIVLFWSDHGPGMARCKRLLYDSGLHVPLILRVPEKWRGLAPVPPGSVSDGLVSSVDFAPTTLRLAGVPLPAHLQGRPFAGPDLPPPREHVYAGRDRMDERYDMMRAVRDGRYKYIRNYEPWKPRDQFMNSAELGPVKQELNRLKREGALPEGAAWMTGDRKPAEELYDTEADPHELANLAGDPAHAETLARLRAAQDQWMADSRDLGLLPEAELNRLGNEHGTRYAVHAALAAADPTFWDTLRTVAALAGAGAPEGVMQLLSAAKDSPHVSVRWWAMIGLDTLPAAPREARAALRKALDAPSALVRVAAAAGVVRRMPDDAAPALEVLKAALADGDEWIRLQAALALDGLGPRARPALGALRAALNDGTSKYVVRVANHAVNALTGETNEVN